MPVRGSASIAPVCELRRNSRPSAPDSSRALTTVAVGQRHARAGGDVEAGLDHAVVAERDARPALAPSRQRSPSETISRAAAGQRAHDRGAAADVRAVAHHDAGRDAALDHRGAERAGVEVDEALVHHRRALGEVGAEPHAVGVGDPHARRDDVVRHARELVERGDDERLAGGAEAQPDLGQRRRVDRPAARSRRRSAARRTRRSGWPRAAG